MPSKNISVAQQSVTENRSKRKSVVIHRSRIIFSDDKISNATSVYRKGKTIYTNDVFDVSNARTSSIPEVT